jgi:putative DNA primase/helicase
LVREFFGAAIAGQMTRYAKALLLLGDGSNGKSTLLQIIEALFPTALRASVLPHDMSRPFARATLTGKVINIVTEMSKNAILDSEGFKAIISGDQIQAEQKHENAFVFKPTAAHVFAANTLPAVADSSDGFWRRWLVIQFNRTFTRADAKPGLAEEIVREELGLIASWLIDAAAAVWQRGYFSETEEIAARRRAWRGESDAIQMFLTDLMEDDSFGFSRPDDADDDEGLFVENGALYAKYQIWSQMTGLRTRGQTTLSRELARMGIKKDRRCGKRGFVLPKDVGSLLH